MSSGHELKHFYTCVERLLDMCWRTTRHEPCSAFALWGEMNDTMVTLLPLSCCLKARGFTNPLSFYIVWWSYCDLHPLTPYAATPRWSQHCSAAGHCLLDPYLQLFMMVSVFCNSCTFSYSLFGHCLHDPYLKPQTFCDGCTFTSMSDIFVHLINWNHLHESIYHALASPHALGN